jgi:hypothetical protein
MNHTPFKDNHPGSPGGTSGVVGRVALLKAVVPGKVSLMRREDNPAWGGFAVEL